MPPNLQTVSLKFARRVSAKVMGSLAVRESEPQKAEEVTGIMVTHNFNSKIVKAEDLATYTPLRVGSIFSKLHVPYTGSIETLRLFLSEMFAGVTETPLNGDDDQNGFKFSLHDDKVSISYFSILLLRLSEHCLILLSFFRLGFGVRRNEKGCRNCRVGG